MWESKNNNTNNKLGKLPIVGNLVVTSKILTSTQPPMVKSRLSFQM